MLVSIGMIMNALMDGWHWMQDIVTFLDVEKGLVDVMLLYVYGLPFIYNN
jgi:hypothetical protein